MASTTKSSSRKSKNKGAGQGSRSASKQLEHTYFKRVGLKAKNSLDLVRHVEKGLSFATVESLREQMQLTTNQMSELLDIKLRTLLRRKEEGRLLPAESDRVLRASRLFTRATDLFDGDADAARRWLLTPQRALGGALPLTIARTEIGAREVEQIIGRLEQGVFT